jgi:uncharacterized protein (DUF1015 family)
MAEIAAFRGLLYNQALVPDLDAVITPPYDVISPEQQEMYYRRHPYNFIRLILGRKEPGDDERNNWYTRAAAILRTWQEKKVLIRDPRPALYDYEIDYQESPDTFKTRQGFICLVRLQDFSQGSVRPHERTYEATKSERLKLITACNADLSQVFALYSDSARVAGYCLEKGRDEVAAISFTDSTGIRHRMWRVTQAEVIRQVAAVMKDKSLFIADGHHRYETALSYQRLMQQRHADLGVHASFNFVLMYLCNMDQPGLTILPTHRMFVHLPHFEMEAFLAQAKDYFEVVRFPFDADRRTRMLDEFISMLRSAGDRHFIGVYLAGSREFVLLKLRTAANHEAWNGRLPKPLQQLDVVVLTELVLKRFLNLDERLLNDERQIQYRHSAWEAVEQVDKGLFHLTFLINPTRISQVQEVANSGLVMPHKSTYFYPKVIDGSVLNLVDPHEEVSC